MNRVLVASLLTLTFPAFAAAAPEAADLSSQFASATAMIDADAANSSVYLRDRPIGEKVIVAVGECRRDGNGNNAWSFRVSYKQLVELYEVEVSRGRCLFNRRYVEKIVPDSQTKALRQWFEEVPVDGAGASDVDCVKERALYLQRIPAE